MTLICHETDVRFDSEQLRSIAELNILRKVEDPIIEAFFGDHFYDDRLDSHSIEAREFASMLVTDTLWPRHRRFIKRKVRTIKQLEARAADEWQGEHF